FTDPGGAGVNYDPTVSALGRINPFALSVMGPGSANGLPTAFMDPGNVLRISGARASLPSFTQWGLVVVQAPPNFGGTSFDPSGDVVILKYGLTLGSGAGDFGDIVGSVPLS